MEPLLAGVDWVAVIIGAVAAFVVGAIWYSPMMFGNKWRQGLGTAAVPNRSMGPLLLTEAVACFLLAWLTVLLAGSSMALAIFAAIAVAVTVKANSLFGGKSLYAVSTEAGYVLAKVAVVLIAYQIFK
jgi:hypothetical protein